MSLGGLVDRLVRARVTTLVDCDSNRLAASRVRYAKGLAEGGGTPGHSHVSAHRTRAFRSSAAWCRPLSVRLSRWTAVAFANLL